MPSHQPPVPPDQRPRHGESAGKEPVHEKPPKGYRPEDRNLKEQGRQGNIAENTRNQGYQEDR